MKCPDNRRIMHPRPASATVLALLLWLPAAQAETHYVIDRLLVGVHAEKNLDSAIVKVLPTGTAVEVVERDGELALIEDGENTRGWVDGAYLTTDRPALLRLAELEKARDALAAQLAAARGEAAGAGAADAGSAAQVDALTKENTELKGKLSEERLRAGKLQAEAAALRARVESSSAPPDARIVELERDREQLRGELERAGEKITELTARASRTATPALLPLVLREYAMPLLIAGLIVVIAAFACGAWAIDAVQRRRHGGFRV